MSDWMKWIHSIAAERVDEIERHMLAHPADFPHFVEASHGLDSAMKADRAEAISSRDDAWVNYTGALAVELYLAGARDGDRIYHAFITGELPSIQKPEGEHHEQTDS